MKTWVWWLVLGFSFLGCVATKEDEKMFDTGESVGVFKLDGQDVVTGWSAAGKLLTPDENGVTADRLVSLQQQFERAEAYTVTFDLNKPERANPVRPTSAVADVDWICAGNTIRRRLVIASGTTISGLANAIRISIRDQSGITGVAPGTLAREYVVSVSVSRGTRVPTVSPPLAPLANTDQFVTVTNPMVKSITIPINIGVNAVAVIPGKLTSGGVQVDIRFRDVICTLVDPLNNILAKWAPSESAPQWIPMMPDASLLTIDVTQGGFVMEGTVLFSVDG